MVLQLGLSMLLATTPVATPSASPATDYAVETSAFLGATEFAGVHDRYTALSALGGYGTNKDWDETHKGHWYIEEQKWGADLVNGGVNRGDVDAIDRGMKMLGWGFSHENPDGSFSCPDNYHSTTFFVEAVAHALLILDQSPYRTRYAAQRAAWLPQLVLAARWLADAKNIAASMTGPMSSAPYTHRRWLVAAALGETAALTPDPALSKAAEESARLGLSQQDVSGYNPEKGGYDSSYHAVGLMYALRYEAYAAPQSLRRPIEAMLTKAVAWAATRILPDGTMDLRGNTRIGPADAENNREGQRKQPNYRCTFRDLYYWYVLKGDDLDRVLAINVALRWPELARMSGDTKIGAR